MRAGRDDWMTSIDHALARARPVGWAARRLAVVTLAAGAIVWYALYRALDERSAVALAIAGVLLALPPLALGAFALAVRALITLPRKIRESPGALRERAEVIRRRAGEVAGSQGRGAIGALVATVRLWWAVASSREILEVLGPTTLLLTPWTVVFAAAGAAAAVLEILAAVVALAWLAIT